MIRLSVVRGSNQLAPEEICRIRRFSNGCTGVEGRIYRCSHVLVLLDNSTNPATLRLQLPADLAQDLVHMLLIAVVKQYVSMLPPQGLMVGRAGDLRWCGLTRQTDKQMVQLRDVRFGEGIFAFAEVHLSQMRPQLEHIASCPSNVLEGLHPDRF